MSRRKSFCSFVLLPSMLFVMGVFMAGHADALLAQVDDGEASAANPDYQLEEFPPLPSPTWVQMIDQGAANPELAGIRTPAGIGVEIVAREPAIIDPVGMTFADLCVHDDMARLVQRDFVAW